MADIPLFPLKTVLFPGNPLGLKIFESRYLDMIADCMREDGEFGVVLIDRGEETSAEAEIYSIGTTARIADWEHRSDGLLGITALGVRRFQILQHRTEPNGLLRAEVKLLDDDGAGEIPEQYRYMLDLLDHISAQAGQQREQEPCYSDVLYQLISLLPLEVSLKQRLLELPACADRAGILHAELIRLGVIQYLQPDAS
jgi:Lon protease-like protein